MLARFLTADTVYDAGPQGLNRYSYALNNPIVYIDPTGHFIQFFENLFASNLSRSPIISVNPGLKAGNVAVKKAMTPVGEAGLVEGAIPVWGDGRDCLNAVQTGHYIQATIYGGMMMSDLLDAGVGPDDMAKAGVKAGKEVVEEVVEEGVEKIGKEGVGLVDEGVGLIDEGVEGVSKNTPTDLHAFGNKTRPRPARPYDDFGVSDVTDVVGPESPPLPNGASTFGDVGEAPLTGQYHRIPEGTALPEGLDVVADGADVLPNSPHPRTHHTIYPNQSMTVEEFNDKFLSLPWEHAGKKK